MCQKTFFELKDELSVLQDALHDALENELSPKTISDIETNISKVKDLIADYDLADDDLFKCYECGRVFDIEDSVRVSWGLVCTSCSNK